MIDYNLLYVTCQLWMGFTLNIPNHIAAMTWTVTKQSPEYVNFAVQN